MVEFVDNCLKIESQNRKTSQALMTCCKKFLSKAKGQSYIKKAICDKINRLEPKKVKNQEPVR